MHGKEIDMHRQAIRGYVERISGQGSQPMASAGEVASQAAFISLLNQKPFPTPKFQQADGSFPYMPGYDGPAL